MLHGFAGRLVSEAFLEATLRHVAPAEAAVRARRELVAWRRRSDGLGPTSSLRTMFNAGAEPIAAALGFDPPARVTFSEGAIAASLNRADRSVALLVTAWGEALEPFWREGVNEAISREAACALLFNGTHLRIVDAGRLFTRRYAEFDLDQALDDPATFLALWTMATAALTPLVEASDRHAAVVCRALEDGVLSASTLVLGALAGPKPPAGRLGDVFEQALTIVYRMMFLLFAEARALVPMWHPVYRDSYSLESLRAAAERTSVAPGLWNALRAIARLAHAGCRAGDLSVTPFNGRLFAPAGTPLAERRNLDDEAVRRAILALSTRPSPDRAGRERIAYRDLGVEQLGAVYETLLDYEPAVPAAGGAVGLRAGSGLRKATGTFYTPQPIAEFIVRRTLGPLVENLTPERILQLRVVDPAMGSGAFLVAACRYLSSAYEAALIRAGGCLASDIGEPERAAMRRAVAEHCLYGVDLNPMAVQLARLSIWLTTLAGDRPLSFVDHRLRTGNSLLGAWLSQLARLPQRPRRATRAGAGSGPLLFDEALREGLREWLPVRFSLEAIPNDTIEQVRNKERAFAALNARGSALAMWRRIADLWCAAWLAPDVVPAEAFRDLTDVILGAPGALSPQAAQRYLREADGVASARRVFHWELECPEVFFAADGSRLVNGGFDAVLGNPPWDMIRADHEGAAEEPGRLLRFARDSGVYTAQSGGHANCYQLFAERAVSLARAGGRIGLVLPGGLAADHGSAALRRRFLARCDVDAIVGFENHRGIFPIHRSVRFLLLTASAGRPTDTVSCRFGIERPADLEAAGDGPAARSAWFPIRLAPALLDRLSGEELTIPWLRTPIDLAIAERAAALFPPLGGAAGWSARFGRELNATDDRGLLVREREVGRRDPFFPIVEGKQIEPFAVDLQSSRWAIGAREALGRLRDGRHLRPRLAYRDVASATNQLTLIAAILPGGCVSTHTVFCLRNRAPLGDQHFLCGLFNSLVVNYLVRLRVSTHVTTALVERLPLPLPRQAPRASREIAALARQLSRRRDAAADARLQARVASLYQLTTEEFAYVLTTFPLVPEERRRAALAAFEREAWSANP